MNVKSQAKKLIEETNDNISNRIDTSKTPKRLQVAPETEDDFKFKSIDTTDRSVEMLTQKSNRFQFNTKGTDSMGLDILYDKEKVLRFRPSPDLTKMFSSSTNTTSKFDFSINGAKDPLHSLGFPKRTGQAYGKYELSNIKNEPDSIIKKVEETETIKRAFSRSRQYAEDFVNSKLFVKSVKEEDFDEEVDNINDVPPLHRVAYTANDTPFNSPDIIGKGSNPDRIRTIMEDLEQTSGLTSKEMGVTPVYEENSQKLVGLGKRPQNKIPVSPAIGSNNSAFQPITPAPTQSPAPVKSPEPVPKKESTIPALTHMSNNDVKALQKVVRNQKTTKPIEYYDNVRKLLTNDLTIEKVQEQLIEDDAKMKKLIEDAKKLDKLRERKKEAQEIQDIRKIYARYYHNLGFEPLGQSYTLDDALTKWYDIKNVVGLVGMKALKEPAKKRKTPEIIRDSPVTEKPTSARSSPVTEKPTSARSSPVTEKPTSARSSPVNKSPTIEEMRELVRLYPHDENYKAGLQSLIAKENAKRLAKK